jgi:pimeloyl-ACP methyl ester carboxylesterase
MESFVEFRSKNGKWLRGMAHYPGAAKAARAPRDRAPGVVFFHGFTGDRMESHWMFVKCARALEGTGIASLRFDFFGSGESDGDFSEATLRSELADARRAVEFFRRQKRIDANRVGLLGISLGGLIAAALAPAVRARALVLWSAVAYLPHLRTLAESSVTPIPGGGGAVEYNAREVAPQFLDDTLRVDPARAVGRFKRPTLIIHPEKDTHVPLSHAQDYYQAAGAKAKELVIISGAGHTFDSILWEREVIERSGEWFRRHL